MSFHYKVDEVPQELNSNLYQLAQGKIGFVIGHLAILSEDSRYTTPHGQVFAVVFFSCYRDYEVLLKL